MTLIHNLTNCKGSFPRFRTLYADPPWQFAHRTGKMAPEHRRLHRYPTMTIEEICTLPVKDVLADQAHLYLWVPNALVGWGLKVMEEWGFTYKTNIVWYKIRKDGGPDGRGVGFYFRNVTELLLFGTKVWRSCWTPNGIEQERDGVTAVWHKGPFPNTGPWATASQSHRLT
jgi:N6-adenosine-specific RNA methylase IME4